MGVGGSFFGNLLGMCLRRSLKKKKGNEPQIEFSAIKLGQSSHLESQTDQSKIGPSF